MTTPARAPQPATAAPARAHTATAAPAARVSPTAGGVPLAADTTSTVRLLIRRSVAFATATTASARAPDLQAVSAAIAANHMNAAIEDIRAQAALAPVRWSELRGELADLIGEATALEAMLARDPSVASEGSELAKALAELVHGIDPAVLAAAPPSSKPAPFGAADALRLARLEIASARRQVAIFGATMPDGDRALAAKLCEPLHLHLRQAADAASALDRPARLQLDGDIAALSDAMGALAQLLAMQPKLAWHPSFAGAFDAENELRAVVGLPPLARPYTGAIDPQAAMNEVMAMAKTGQVPAMPAGGFADPQAAIRHTASIVDHVFERQYDVMEHFEERLEEQRRVDAPWWQSLLELAVTTALGAVSAGVAGMIAKKLEGSLGAAARDGFANEVSALAGDERETALEQLLQPTAMKRAFAVDSAKEASKTLLKASGEAGLAAVKAVGAQTKSTRALGQFAELHQDAIAAERSTAEAQMDRLFIPLSQLPLDALNALASSLESIPSEAADLMFTRAIYEWENLKARIATGTKENTDPDLRSTGAGPWSSFEPSPGVLEIGLSVDRDPTALASSTLAFMVLRGGEPAACKNIKAQHARFGAVPLNRQYQFSFDWKSATVDYPYMAAGDRDYVNVGVGSQHGFQPGTIDAEEMRLLKRYVAAQDIGAGSRATLRTVETYRDLEESTLTDRGDPASLVRRTTMAFEDAISEQRALAAIRALIQLADQFTTDHLEA